MRWTASALKANCAHPNVLRTVPTADQQRSMDRGTDFHAAIEKWQHDGFMPFMEDLEIQGWLDTLAAQWDPTGKRLEVAWGLGSDASHVMVTETRPHVYEAVSGRVPLLTAGRADAVWIDGSNTLWVVDWKTGRWPVEPPATNLQVNAAGLALAYRWGATSYVPGIYYARDGVFEWHDAPVALDGEFAAAAFEAVSRAAMLPETPIVGEHCRSCWELKFRRCKEGVAYASKCA